MAIWIYTTKNSATAWLNDHLVAEEYRPEGLERFYSWLEQQQQQGFYPVWGNSSL